MLISQLPSNIQFLPRKKIMDFRVYATIVQETNILGLLSVLTIPHSIQMLWSALSCQTPIAMPLYCNYILISHWPPVKTFFILMLILRMTTM